MNFNRLRELSGLTEAPMDSLPGDPPMAPSDPVPNAATPALPEDQPAPTTSSSQRLDQIIVVMDVPVGSTTNAQDLSIDDVMTICSPTELVNLIKGCDKECNYSLYPVSARAEAEADAAQRIGTRDQISNFEDTEGAQASVENEVMSKDEWTDPVTPEVRESIEVGTELVPASIKDAPVTDESLPKEYNVRVKSLIKDLDDCLAACEVGYKHNYMEDRLDDAGTNLKMLEVLTKLKHFLQEGKVNQATTFYTSLTNIYQDKIPVSVRKFLQHGGRDQKPLSGYFKAATKGE